MFDLEHVYVELMIGDQYYYPQHRQQSNHDHDWMHRDSLRGEDGEEFQQDNFLMYNLSEQSRWFEEAVNEKNIDKQ